MTLKLSVLVGMATLASSLMVNTAHAHSPYWECAVAAGSPDAVQAACGLRSDYDAAQAARAEQNAQEAADRAERESRYQPSYDSSPSYYPSSPSYYPSSPSYSPEPYSPPAPVRRPARVTLPVSLNSRVVDGQIDIGAQAGLSRYSGYSLVAVKIEAQGVRGSRVDMIVNGYDIAAFNVAARASAKKSFGLSNVELNGWTSSLALSVQGDVVVKRVTLTLMSR